MDGRRTTLVVSAIVAGVVAGGSAAAALPSGTRDLLPDPTLPTVPTVTVPTVPITVPTVPTVTTTVPTVPTVPITTPTVPTTTTTVPTVPATTPTLPPTTVPITTNSPLPSLPSGGGLPPVTAGNLDATTQIVTSSGAGPQVERLIVPDKPTTGKPVSFTIAAKDDRPVTGLTLDFGEAGARFGESSCRKRSGSRRGTFSVPYTFAVAGPHVINFS